MYAQNNFYTQADYSEVIPFPSIDAPTSYVDANDLAEVLEAFFLGTLNNMDEYLPRLYKGLAEFHPTNSLYGQLTEEELTQCLHNLTQLEKAAIEYRFAKSKKSEIILTHAYLNDPEAGSNFASYAEQLYIEAIELLSFEILDIL
jgi:hypothetical protein